MGSRRAKTKTNKVNKYEAHEKKQKKIKIFMGGFLVIIMFLGMFSVMLYNDSPTNNSLDENGFGFNLEQSEYYEFWNVSVTPKDKRDFKGTTFMYLPENGPNYAFNGNMNDTTELLLNSSFVYVANDPSIIDAIVIQVLNETNNETAFELKKGENFNDTLQVFQIQNWASTNLVEILNKVTVPLQAITTESALVQGQVINCNNATEDIPIISFISNNETEEGISLENNCIIINAETPSNYLVYADMLKYALMVK